MDLGPGPGLDRLRIKSCSNRLLTGPGGKSNSLDQLQLAAVHRVPTSACSSTGRAGAVEWREQVPRRGGAWPMRGASATVSSWALPRSVPCLKRPVQVAVVPELQFASRRPDPNLHKIEPRWLLRTGEPARREQARGRTLAFDCRAPPAVAGPPNSPRCSQRGLHFCTNEPTAIGQDQVHLSARRGNAPSQAHKSLAPKEAPGQSLARLAQFGAARRHVAREVQRCDPEQKLSKLRP